MNEYSICYHVLVMYHLNGWLTGMFMDENDVILFFQEITAFMSANGCMKKYVLVTRWSYELMYKSSF